MKKYSSGSLIDAAVRVYGSEADTISSFPATIYADGENASATVYGNMVQSGTPTPTTPITPSECGDLETTGEHTGQYKIPIQSANTSTPIYLGEVQTTRRIKKYEITGNERWVKESTGDTPNRYHGNDILTDCGNNLQGVCSHFVYAVSNNYGNIFIASNKTDIFVLDENITSAQALSEYFAQEYSNGTPVTVWYVLATPTTAILNEPLRKIGEYADTVSATIPTIAAADNINVTTTLKPSAVQLTYTGWHDHSDKKRSGGAWT